MGAPASSFWANQSWVCKFELLGFGHVPTLHPLLAMLFLAAFLVMLLGNVFIVLLTALDPALHKPMYFFLLQLTLVEICFSLDIMAWLLVTLMPPLLGHVAHRLCPAAATGASSWLPWMRLVCVHLQALALWCHHDPMALPCFGHPFWLAGVPMLLVFIIWLFHFPFCGPHGISLLL